MNKKQKKNDTQEEKYDDTKDWLQIDTSRTGRPVANYKAEQQKKVEQQKKAEETKRQALFRKAFEQAQQKAEEQLNQQKKEALFTKAFEQGQKKAEEQVNDQKLAPEYYMSITEQNLIVYDIFTNNSLKIPSENPSEKRIELEQLNNYVKCLQSQIFKTNSINNRETPFEQQQLGNQGTIRIQGLFETSSNEPCKNMLSADDDNAKVAIKASEGNPNGTLACCLSQALQYLEEKTNIIKKQEEQEGKTPRETIEEIYSASRGSTGKNEDDVKEGSESSLSRRYKDFGEDLLKNFWGSIIKSNESNEDKLTWIMRVYGPLLNKGLSDISQAGELAKYYILKFLEDKQKVENNKTKVVKIDEKKNVYNFWEITSGRPSLAAFSSDIIASALGVRIQNIFKGQFQSVLPRKTPNSRSSVMYIPYKYIGLMEVLSRRLEIGEIKTIMENFQKELIKFTRTLGNSSFGNIFSNEFFMKMRDLVNNIYKYYKLNDEPGGTFYKNILEIIDEIIDTNENGINFNNNRNKANIFINIINSFDIFELIYTKKSDKSPKTCFNESLEMVKNILIQFGVFIKNLKDFVDTNEMVLINIIKQKMDIAKQRENEELYFPSWTGTLYSTISYYDNCLEFNNMSDENLLELYLNISKTEESCAEQDTDYGHDQNIDEIQKFGIEVANDWLNKGEGDNLRNIKKQVRETISKTHDSFSISSDVSTSQKNIDKRVNERDFSKNLIDKLQYCSVVLTYDRDDGEPILRTSITINPDEDYMFSSELPGGFATRYANNIEPIGNMETWASIDYTVGDPLITKTKHALKQSFTHTEFIEYIKTENMIEIRTPATNFDAAAPSGCLFKTTEKMCVSYRRFTPVPGQGKKDKKEYMYVILTYDLDDKYKNNLILNEESCILKNQPKNLFIEDTILPTGNSITNLMVDFTKKYEYGNKSNNAWRTMWNLLENHYKKPDSKLKQLFQNYNSNLFFQEIEKIFKHMDFLKNEANKSKSKFPTFVKESKSNLPIIFELIGDYYKENCKDYDDSEGTSETKGDDSQENVKCELVKNLLKILVDSYQRTPLYSDSETKYEMEDPVTSFLEKIEKDANYRTLVDIAYAIIELGEIPIPTYEIDKIGKMFTPDMIQNYIKRYTKINNEIIDEVQKLMRDVDMEISIEIIERALNYARIISKENGANFENFNIQNKVLSIIYVINQLTKLDYNIDENTNEKPKTTNKREGEDDRVTEEDDREIKTARIDSRKHGRDDSDEFDMDEGYSSEDDMGNGMDEGYSNVVDMDEDDNQPTKKNRISGGKIKTKKIYKKNKNKLTKRKINHQNKKTRHKLKKKKKNTRHN
jgi:hypothetical protein